MYRQAVLYFCIQALHTGSGYMLEAVSLIRFDRQAHTQIGSR